MMRNHEHDDRARCACRLPNEDVHVRAQELSRRGFLATAIAGTASVLAGSVAWPSPAFAQTTKMPDQAIQALMDGNARFVGGKLSSLAKDLSILKAKTVEKQEPFAAVLSCADSRVPVEFVFDQSIGQLFVVRVAGNVATPEIVASLEYGVAVLGTKAIVVLGHGNCGAVKATIEGKAVPGQISTLYFPIRPAVDAAGSNLDAAIDANAKYQADLIGKASPLMAEAIKGGSLKIVPARYDLATGRVSVL